MTDEHRKQVAEILNSLAENCNRLGGADVELLLQATAIFVQEGKESAAFAALNKVMLPIYLESDKNEKVEPMFIPLDTSKSH
jgi:hypothetical protein